MTYILIMILVKGRAYNEPKQFLPVKSNERVREVYVSKKRRNAKRSKKYHYGSLGIDREYLKDALG